MQLRIVLTLEAEKMYSAYDSRMQEKKKAHTTCNETDTHLYYISACMYSAGYTLLICFMNC